jgi:hypothetical protein
MKILGLGLPSIARPVYGGERRTAAFRDQYVRRGIAYRYIAIRGPDRPQGPIADGEFVIAPANSPFDGIDGLWDVCRGLSAERSDRLLDYLSEAVSSFEATHLQLEQCYLFPAFVRLRSRFPALRLIYSSHNIEAPLKDETLRLRGVQAALREQAHAVIDRWERAAASEADVVVACSRQDADAYSAMGAREVIVARNGVADFPVGELPRGIRRQIQGRRFLIMVGSAHPPNADGFARLVLDQSARFARPPTLLVCGPMVTQIAMRAGGFDVAKDAYIVAVSRIGDPELGAAKLASHGFFLPILSGGGSNLKTAEALVTGKHVVGTRVAFRGFEEFMQEPGVVIADSGRDFKAAIDHVIRTRQPTLTAEQAARRQSVRWEHSLAPFFEWLAALPA